MATKLLNLLIILMLSLSACGQAVTPTAPGQASPGALQTPTTLAVDNSGFTPNPVITPVGGGAYWVASMYKEADGRFSVFIVQPLVNTTPETIFQSESGEFPRFLRWSPDGQYLFFTIAKEQLIQAFYLYDRVNRQLQRFDFQQLTGKQGIVTRADWSPDTQSRQLGFSTCAAMFKECTLWLANMAQGTAVQLKDQGEDWFWDTDGKAMLFEKAIRAAPVRFNLQTMTEEELPMLSSSQLNPNLFTQEGSRFIQYPFFPNVGGYLIGRPNADETWNFYLISESGNQETLLFQTPKGWSGEPIQPPVLSPDGRQIGLNLQSGQDEPTSVIGSLEHLPLQVPATPEPERGLVLLWSPDNSIYVTLAALQGDTQNCSLVFYEAQTGNLLKAYQPPAPFALSMWPGSSSFGTMSRYYFYGFDSVWIP